MPVCSQPGCPIIIPTSGKCPTHKRQADRARGSRQARGYGTQHDALRRAWAPKVATGKVACAKCGQLIARATSWDLGHTDDRTTWTGPEHAHCNRSAAGHASHQ